MARFVPRSRRPRQRVSAAAAAVALAGLPAAAHADPGIRVKADTAYTVTGGSVTLTITNLLGSGNFSIRQERPVNYASNYSCPLGDKFAFNADGNRWTGTQLKGIDILAGATVKVKLNATWLKIGEGLPWNTKVDPFGCQRRWTDFTAIGVTASAQVETAVPLRKLF